MQNATKTSIVASAMQKGKNVDQTLTMLEKAGFHKTKRAVVYALRAHVKNGTFGNFSIKAALSKTSPETAQMLHGFRLAAILPNISTRASHNRHTINAICCTYTKSVNQAERMKVRALKTAIKGLTRVMNG